MVLPRGLKLSIQALRTLWKAPMLCISSFFCNFIKLYISPVTSTYSFELITASYKTSLVGFLFDCCFFLAFYSFVIAHLLIAPAFSTHLAILVYSFLLFSWLSFISFFHLFEGLMYNYRFFCCALLSFMSPKNSFFVVVVVIILLIITFMCGLKGAKISFRNFSLCALENIEIKNQNQKIYTNLGLSLFHSYIGSNMCIVVI